MIRAQGAQGTVAQAPPRKIWPFVAGGVGALVVVGGVMAAVLLQPAEIDDEITNSNAKEIARLMEAQVDVELAIVNAPAGAPAK